MDNAQRFLASFIRIEKQLKLITGEKRYTKFYMLLEEATRKNKIAKRFEMELQEYADLRNAIVHQRDGKGEVIAQPTDEVTKDIEHIAEVLCDYNPVSKYFLKNVIVCGLEDSILSIQKVMQDNEFSKIPVCDRNEIVGILNVEHIAKWACEELGNKSKRWQVKDIYEATEQHHGIHFISKNANVHEVIQLINEDIKKGVKIQAILITEAGIKSQKPIGIITIKDLPQILEFF